jgi:hypothetical protein
MYQIPNISNDPNQSINFVLPDGVNTAKLTLRYLSNIRAWYMDLEYQDFSCNNRRICSSPNMLRQWKRTLPFGLGCYTLDGSDPYFIDDFQNGRCGLLVLTPDEIDNFEGYLIGLKNAAI